MIKPLRVKGLEDRQRKAIHRPYLPSVEEISYAREVL